jgi:hypothetical protein
MRRNRVVSDILPLIGLVITLAVAYGFDRWMDTRELAGWVVGLSNLLLSGLLLALWWLMNLEDARSRLVAVVFLLIGLLLTFGPSLLPDLRLQLPFSLAFLMEHNALMCYAGGFVAVMGLVGLFPVRRKRFDRFFRSYDQRPRPRM